ncbi:MAG: ATP phosphoribosyltransferase [Candidatus Atribacteria bacterium]|nr:ATP phosphoribosyltransferase [Candidatus Atribacteria bacterium]
MNSMNKSSFLTIAVPSGRLFQPIMELLQKTGYFGGLQYDLKKDRRLIFFDQDRKFRFIITKPKDNPTYVEWGVADIGIVGKDVLWEEKKDVYELLDLHLGNCLLVLAGSRPKEEIMMSIEQKIPLRIATKYPNISRNYCLQKGIYGEIITLFGSVELAPQVGLADVIIDLVSTGKTLRENNLKVIDEIASSSARLITNHISYKTKHEQIHQIVQVLREMVEQKG